MYTYMYVIADAQDSTARWAPVEAAAADGAVEAARAGSAERGDGRERARSRGPRLPRVRAERGEAACGCHVVGAVIMCHHMSKLWRQSLKRRRVFRRTRTWAVCSSWMSRSRISSRRCCGRRKWRQRASRKTTTRHRWWWIRSEPRLCCWDFDHQT